MKTLCQEDSLYGLLGRRLFVCLLKTLFTFSKSAVIHRASFGHNLIFGFLS